MADVSLMAKPDASCTLCGKPAPEDHHPFGRNQDDLTVPRCRDCHEKASYRQQLQGADMRKRPDRSERERHLTALRLALAEQEEIALAAQRHLDALEGELERSK